MPAGGIYLGGKIMMMNKNIIRTAMAIAVVTVTVNVTGFSANAEQSVTVTEEEITMVAPAPVEETPVVTPVEEPAQEETPVVTTVEEPAQEETPVVTPAQESAQEETPATEPTVESTQEETPATEPTVEPTQEETPVVTPAQESTQVIATETTSVVESQQTTTETMTTVEPQQTTATSTIEASVVEEQVEEVVVAEEATVDAAAVKRSVSTTSTEAEVLSASRESEADTTVSEDKEISEDNGPQSHTNYWLVALLFALLLIALLWRYNVVIVKEGEDGEEDTDRSAHISFKKACEEAASADDENVLSVKIEAAGLYKLYRKLRNENVDDIEVIYRKTLCEDHNYLYESVYATDSEIDTMEEILGYYLDRDNENPWILPEDMEKIAADKAAELAQIGAQNLVELALNQE